MFSPGQLIFDANGSSYSVEKELRIGGQGEAFAVEETTIGRLAVAKVYNFLGATPEAEKRLDRLFMYKLGERSRALIVPTVRLSAQHHGPGVIMPRVLGESLYDMLQTEPYFVVEAIGLATAICRALMVTERLGIAHGDLAASNLMITRVGSHYEVYIIDWDNAFIPGAPLPPLDGQGNYMAPELLAGRTKPTVETDRHALGVLLHEILLRRFPYAAAMGKHMPWPDYVQFMQQATWAEDPLAGGKSPADAAVPLWIYPRSIQALFRDALQPQASRRPSAETWARELSLALTNVLECSQCGGHFVHEPESYRCPYPACNAWADILELGLRSGQVIPFTAMNTVIGRAELGGDPTISREHAVFRRRGHILTLQVLSANGMMVHTHERRWRMLKKNEKASLAEGERVLFATGVEGVIRARRP